MAFTESFIICVMYITCDENVVICLVEWARTCTKGYRGVKVKDMTTSWRDGLAFCAILHSFHPDKV